MGHTAGHQEGLRRLAAAPAAKLGRVGDAVTDAAGALGYDVDITPRPVRRR